MLAHLVARCKTLNTRGAARFVTPLFQYKTFATAVNEDVNLHEIANIAHDERTIHVEWKNGYRSSFHNIFLRHHCYCPRCQHSTGQRLLTMSDIPETLKVKDIEFKGSELSVTWDPEGHISRFDSKWLENHSYSEESLLEKEQMRITKPITSADPIPTIAYDEIVAQNGERGIFKWLHLVVEHGLCIVKNVPCVDGEVQRLAEKIAKISHASLYGNVFDVVSEAAPVNIAYTPLKLNFHMDLAYFESPPGVQMLHCIQFGNNVKGGESTFTDTFLAAERFRIQDPVGFETLCRVPATFVKRHLSRAIPAWMEYQRPHISLNHRQQVVGVFWSPPFEGVLSIPAKDVEGYYAAYRKFEKIINGTGNDTGHVIKTRLQPGDVAVFNQRRMLHGREAFSGDGTRHFQGTYLNIDEVMSRYRILRENYAERKDFEKRSSNGSFS